MASGLLIKQKQLLAGDGIAIDHGETASTISLAENALDNAVRIYDATVESSTGVVTITDGTPVSDLAIGDEIRTPDGVYQKTKDNITTTGSADGTRIEVSGITNPADANGVYILTETEKVWKHESANYWILLWSDAYWMITNYTSPTNPSESNFYAINSYSHLMPWEVPEWNAYGSEGYPSLVNAPAEQTITDTLALFEYASLPVKPENIVQSVNGKKPDASGNVTIETSSGGLTSVSVGNGLTGNGTSSNPLTLDLSNYEAPGSVQINSSAALNSAIKLSSGFTEHSGGSGGASEMAQSWYNELIMDADGLLLMTDVGATIKVPSISKLKLEQGRHSGAANKAYGLAVVGSNGKLPDTILPSYVKTVNNVAPDGTGNVSIELPAGGLTSVSVGNGLTGNGTSSNPVKLDLSNAVMEHNCAVNAQGNTFTVGNLTTASIQTTNIDLAVSSEFLLQFPGHNINITINPGGIDIQTTAIRLNGCSQNTAGGFAIVGEDGKLPSSIIPVSSNRHPFTSSDLSSNVLTITTTGNVTGVIDDSGKAWNFADEEVTYTDSTVSVDLSGVLARKGIVTPAGTWKLMLYGA